MTTWTANKSNEVNAAYQGNVVQKTYLVSNGVTGDTGGTLTCTGLKSLDDCTAKCQLAAEGIATFARISGNTVVVSYNNPADAHTVRITVWGLKK